MFNPENASTDKEAFKVGDKVRAYYRASSKYAWFASNGEIVKKWISKEMEPGHLGRMQRGSTYGATVYDVAVTDKIAIYRDGTTEPSCISRKIVSIYMIQGHESLNGMELA